MSKYSELFREVVAGGESTPPLPPDDDAVLMEYTEAENRYTLLFVDDEDGVLRALRRIFIDENYEILTAESAEKALALLEKQTVHLVVSDHRMPGMTGAQLLKEIKQKWPDTIRIMLTGYADVQSIMGAVKEGAVFKFITKPWNDEDLRLTVSLALQQYALIRENRKLKDIARSQQSKIRNFAGLFEEDKSMLGGILIEAGVIRKDDFASALQGKKNGEPLVEALVRLNVCSEAKILKSLQNHLGIEFIDLREVSLSPGIVKCLPRDMCEKHHLIPVRLDGNRLTIAMADPSDIFKIDNISRVLGMKVVPLLSTRTEIQAQLARVYGDLSSTVVLAGGEEMDEYSELEPLDEIDIVIEDDELDVALDELIGSSKVPPVIRIVNSVISEAIRYRASDIHIEPKTKCTVIRYRIDGLLHGKIRIPSDIHAAVISRVKILAKMDISERRKPQDGRITVKAGTRVVDMRVSTLPTLNGEKVVMRILDKSASIRGLDELGVLPDDMRKLTVLSKKPQGVIIATGPTGSGKTTMLYSLLSAMMDSHKNFETIEEPVEYFLEDANQVAVRDKIGLSFAQILRSTLRQDPDVIMVGEIRDHETADVAFKASLTGHMVLTTLHTNSAVASITRLVDMGIKPYIIASALEGILAQRLVRRVCDACRVPVTADREQLELLRVPSGLLDGGVYRGKGCDKCNNTGYQGRLGVYELFSMNDDFRHFISSGYRESELVEMARANGMRTLVEDGIEKVRLGLTTLDELLRVIGPQMIHERVCGTCRRHVDARFLFCPYCGTFKSNCCRNCKMPLEDEWIICPFCGSEKGQGCLTLTEEVCE
jgi:type II secretory ATPase GspE/PulE/Tfp pilus assembly ATPase PilB-like protein/FixJ family two-component response regulator/RNA polymerase subunit RPABC4/transcription elongation factor Spt4